MKTTLIRVTRVQHLTVTEHIDVPILQDADAPAYPSVEDIATNLIEAMDAAGQDIDWFVDSEKVESYPKATVTGKVIEQGAVPAADAA